MHQGKVLVVAKREELAPIFSPFFSMKNGGTIRVESIQGKGTTFEVSLLVAE
ncbi:MAG: hypothetical protein ACM3TN_13865 [Alphaproteobacteria bacterium]